MNLLDWMERNDLSKEEMRELIITHYPVEEKTPKLDLLVINSWLVGKKKPNFKFRWVIFWVTRFDVVPWLDWGDLEDRRLLNELRTRMYPIAENEQLVIDGAQNIPADPEDTDEKDVIEPILDLNDLTSMEIYYA